METHLFCDEKVKGQDHNVCIGLQTKCNIAAVYISHAGFSPAWVFALLQVLASSSSHLILNRNKFNFNTVK